MIYINNNTRELTFPNYANLTGLYTVELESNLTHHTVTIPDLSNTSNNKFYLCFTIDEGLSLTTGEYTYKVTNNSKTVATGLLVYGDYQPSNTVYNTDKKFKSYEG